MPDLSGIWILLGFSIGLVLAIVLLFVSAKRNVRKSNLVARTILWGHMLTIVAMWPALGQSGSRPYSQRSLERFEFGWIVIATMCVVLTVASWRDRRRPSKPLAFMVGGLIGVMIAQFVSWKVADASLPMMSYVPMIVIAICLVLFPLDFGEVVTSLVIIMAVLCSVSIAVMVSGADWAMPVGEPRTLPGPNRNWSLGGVLMHPNQLGPVATMGLALALSNWRRVYVPLVLLFAATLWLTDSRTQVATAFVVFAVWGIRQLRAQLGWKETVQIAGGLIVSASIGIVGVLATRGWSLGVPTFGLAGRPHVWAKALDYWQSSIWVGVGPVAFDDGWLTPNGRKVLGAHNEVMQALSAEGLLGLLPLLCLLGGFAFAVRAAHGRAKFTLVLMSIFALALISMETPLRPQQTITGLGILFVSTIFALVSASSTTRESESSQVSSRGTSNGRVRLPRVET
jgi:hypothetical protein